MAKYSTKQRSALLSFFKNRADTTFTARQVAGALGAESVSVSAVYRNLAELEASGAIRKCGESESREALYRYMDADECQGCLHLSCKRCGKTVHLAAEITDRLTTQLDRVEQFALDKRDTVLYGVCEDCRER